MKVALACLLYFIGCAVSLASDFDSKVGSFTDASRDRKIPYKVYYPKPLTGQYPVIIVSHGLGGSRDGNGQLGKQLASSGFIAIHIQHLGSDESLLDGVRDRRMVAVKLGQSLQQPINALNRFMDAQFVVAQLPALNDSDKQLRGHVNLELLGMAGHSYGAVSTLVAAGERIGLRNQSFKIPAVRAGLLLSPSPPRGDSATAYRDVTIPLFHVTGTEDVALVEQRDVQATDRVKPYRALTIPKQYLLVLDRADHVTFSGRRIDEGEAKPLDKQHMTVVLSGAMQFFRAYLLDDVDAEKWLLTEYKKTLGEKDVFEFK